jgi:hypothetical protein
MGVNDGENSKAGIAGGGKPRNVARRVQPIAGKRDRLIVISKEEATSELVV